MVINIYERDQSNQSNDYQWHIKAVESQRARYVVEIRLESGQSIRYAVEIDGLITL